MLTLEDFLRIDLPALLVAVLASVSCSLLGTWLVLRREALVGDALSHVVLPGIVVAFIVTQSVETVPMMAGALVSSLVAVALVEVVRRLGRLEPGAALGVVFTTLFAAGVVLLEQGVGTRVHLDAQHALYGALETTLWVAPTDWASLLDPAVWAELPRQITALLVVTLAITGLTIAFYKELKITTFDPGLATSLGISARWVSAGLMVMVAVAVVASFEAVGSILVVAMIVCPPATARMLTDRLSVQLVLGAAIGAASGIFGYIAAAWLPLWLGRQDSLSAAGMIAVVAGLFQLAAMLFAPRYGALAGRRVTLAPMRLAPSDGGDDLEPSLPARRPRHRQPDPPP